jgi:hypothetical protein
VAHPHQWGMGTATNAILSPPAFDTCVVAHVAILPQPRQRDFRVLLAATPHHARFASLQISVGRCRL